jgi:hypothetical protein
MPGKELGAGRVALLTSYRMNGSLPIPNHTMQGVAVSIDRTFDRQISQSASEQTASCDKVKEHLTQFAASSLHAAHA